MMTANSAIEPTIRQRLCEIQATWSDAERRRRAKEGELQRERLFSLISHGIEPEIWAVGAPVPEDSQRIAG